MGHSFDRAFVSVLLLTGASMMIARGVYGEANSGDQAAPPLTHQDILKSSKGRTETTSGFSRLSRVRDNNIVVLDDSGQTRTLAFFIDNNGNTIYRVDGRTFAFDALEGVLGRETMKQLAQYFLRLEKVGLRPVSWRAPRVS